MTIKLGTAVTYFSAKGQPKAAIVIGTHETIEVDTSVPQPDEFNLNLLVFAPNGNVYPKVNVPPVSDVQKESAYSL